MRRTCPNCGHTGDIAGLEEGYSQHGTILELALFLDHETDEVTGRELQCSQCWHRWEEWVGTPVQTTLRKPVQ